MTLYLIRAECPNCESVVKHVRETDAPVALDQDVPIAANYCEACGIHLRSIGAEWDVVEEHEIERVAPTQERGQA